MTSRPHRPLAAALALFALLAGLGAGTAVGHAELDTVSPADKSTVQGSPTVIAMTFTQDLDPAKSSIRVADATGKVVVQGGTVSAGSPREMNLALATPLPPGAYEIRWISFSSEDDERDSGKTTFTVAAVPSVPPSVAPSAAAPTGSAAVPSAAPSAIASAASSTPPATPATSTGDAVIPIVVALIVLAGLGLWLLRGRARAR